MDELLKNPVFVSHTLAAGAAVAIGTTVSYPLDTIKALIQVGASPNKKLTVIQVLGRVKSLSGYSGLYRGVSWLTFGRITSLGARFGVYEILTAYYKDGLTDHDIDISEAILAGMAGGAVEAFLNTPFEMIKLRKQITAAVPISVSSASGTEQGLTPLISRLLPGLAPNKVALDRTVTLLSVLSKKNHNMADALKNYPWTITGSGKQPGAADVKRPLDIVRLEGLRAMWRGLRSGIARDSLFGGTFFGSWQFLHLVMVNWKAVHMDPIPERNDEVDPLDPLHVSLAAGFSGALAGATSHSFDTSKTRSQGIVLPRYLAMERKFFKWKRPGNWYERQTGIHPADRQLLSRGSRIRMARCGLASFILVRSYFALVEHFVPKS